MFYVREHTLIVYIDTCDEWQTVHGAGGVPLGIKDSVCRNYLLCLSHDATAHRAKDLQNLRSEQDES